MTQSKIGFCDALVSAAYEAPLSDDGWAPVLRELLSLTDSVAATFYFVNSGTDDPVLFECVGLDAETIRSYHSTYLPLDPLLPVVQAAKPGHWFDDQRDLPAGILERSAFRQDFYRPRGLSTCAGMNLIRADQRTAGISLVRGVGQQAYDDELVLRLERCADHLMRAARMFEDVRNLRKLAGFGLAALDRQPDPLWVIEGNSRILIANTAAEEVCQEGSRLKVKNGRLTAADGSGRQLAGLIRQAAGQDGPPRAGAMRLRAVDEDTVPWPVSVVPLPARSSLAAPWQAPLVLVMVRRLDCRGPDAALILRQVFALTPAETRLALLLLDETNPAHCAERLGVSLPTVRSQLRAIYAKTGSETLSALLRLLATLAG